MTFERFLKKNLVLKILSVTLAAFLWIFVHLTQTASGFNKFEANFRVPIVVENLAPTLRVVESDQYVTVAFKGIHDRSVEGIKPSDFKASVDLDGKGPGTFRGLPVHVASPVGTVVTGIEPSEAEVVLDEGSDKTVPVIWEFPGNKNPGKISVVPGDVVVKGPKTLVDRVVAARIQIPESESLQAVQDEYAAVPVDVLSRPVPGPSVIPQKVRVITKYSESAKPLPVRPDIIGKLPVGMELKSVSVNPTVVLADMGNRGTLPDHLDTSPIDVTDKQGTVTENVKLVVPPGVTIHGKNEVNVVVLIDKRG